jgi:NAD+ synthase (glutamine-hydrolysing)
MKLKQLHVKVGLCSLNNDPLDFKNNLRKIMLSIEECKRLNCSIRVGGELDISGYACEDHFLEYDTIFHSWDVIKDILVSGVTNGIVAEVGCPILHKAALYNGRVILHNSKVIAIRVKMILADGGNYFETRHFSAWKYPRQVGEFMLPQIIQDVT